MAEASLEVYREGAGTSQFSEQKDKQKTTKKQQPPTQIGENKCRMVLATVLQSTASVLEPVTFPGANQSSNLPLLANGPLLSDGDALAAQPRYMPPYPAAFSVQNARPLPSGQPLPQGVKAFGLALPAQQQS